MNYAGDVDPTEAWKRLSENERSVLVDVRSEAEWSFVGIPDLTGIGKRPLFLSWQIYPSMTENRGFVDGLAKAVTDKDTPLYFICRSGGRSRAAAIMATAAGYRHCYNVADGFEGNPDAARHRGRIAGWKAAGLPWTQD
ncbi:MAG: sulfurtransferase [Alphaproteobacteria bacterium]|nr:MAG: sulfurtransferase [Alphaproteobacteria bacterium]